MLNSSSSLREGCLRGHQIPEKAEQAGWFQSYYLLDVPGEPPRLRRVRWLRAILLMAQPPLLTQEGNRRALQFIHSF